MVRVSHEILVAQPERTVCNLLEDLRLPVDPACLRFHQNMRAVSTPSAEQVRRPINADGIGRWRHYARWLAPLRDALGEQTPNSLQE